MLDAATSASDFDLRKLRMEPMSVYLGVMPKDIHRVQPLLNLFFQQAIALQTDELPEHNAALQQQVLMVLDEFPAIGRIPILAEASGFLPGYNVRTLMIMQTPAQLPQVYGEDGTRTLLKTLAGRIYFQPKDMDDAEEICRELGFTTVKVKTHSRPLFELSSGKGGRHRSVSVSEQRRPLMLAQEVRSLGRGKEIVFTEDTPPILCRKIRYYAVPALCERIRKAPTVPSIEFRQVSLGPRQESTDAPARSAPSSSPTDGAEIAESGEAKREPAVRLREGTVEDVDRADELTEEDFDVDFSRTVVPDHEGPMTGPEMWTAVTSYVASLDQETPMANARREGVGSRSETGKEATEHRARPTEGQDRNGVQPAPRKNSKAVARAVDRRDPESQPLNSIQPTRPHQRSPSSARAAAAQERLRARRDRSQRSRKSRPPTRPRGHPARHQQRRAILMRCRLRSATGSSRTGTGSTSRTGRRPSAITGDA